MRLIDADTAAAFAEHCGATFVAKRLRDSNAFPEVVTRCKECEHAERYKRTDFAATANRRRGNEWTLLGERLLKRGRLMCALVAGANSSKGL